MPVNFCEVCGSEVVPAARFCHRCGERLPLGEPAVAPEDVLARLRSVEEPTSTRPPEEPHFRYPDDPEPLRIRGLEEWTTPAEGRRPDSTG